MQAVLKEAFSHNSSADPAAPRPRPPPVLNKLAKLALVSTALAPICLTLWFVEISSVWQSALPFVDNLATHWQAGSGYLLAALLLSGVCFGLVWLLSSRHELERLLANTMTPSTRH